MSIEDRRLRRRCVRATHRPRFQSAAPYVPYFWSRPGVEEACGQVIAFVVSDRDRRIFPELEAIDVVALRVTAGRVHEARVQVAWPQGS